MVEGFEIVEDHYKMVFDGHRRFDLYFRNKDDWKLQGYSMELLSCLRCIMYHEFDLNHTTVDLMTFFTELKRLYQELSDKITMLIGQDV